MTYWCFCSINRVFNFIRRPPCRLNFPGTALSLFSSDWFGLFMWCHDIPSQVFGVK